MKGTFVTKYGIIKEIEGKLSIKVKAIFETCVLEIVKNGLNWKGSLIESRKTDDVQNDLYESRLFPQGTLQNSTACPVPRSLRK